MGIFSKLKLLKAEDKNALSLLNNVISTKRIKLIKQLLKEKKISLEMETIDTSMAGAIEFPHDYKEGSDITFHVHWQGITAPTGTDNVKWQLTYSVAQMEATLDAATTIVIEEAYDTQYEFKLSNFPAITGTNFNMGDQILFTIERIVAAGDAYAGDALIATVGFHYECDTVGSRQIITK